MMDTRVEPLRLRKEVSIGNMYLWSRYKYTVEVKQKEKDICKVLIAKSFSSEKKDSNPVEIGALVWVFIDDLDKIDIR